MTTTQLIAAGVLLAASAIARAAGPEFVDPAEGFKSTRTRAEVNEELRQARLAGSHVGSESYPGETELMARARQVHESRTELAGEAKPETTLAGR